MVAPRKRVAGEIELLTLGMAPPSRTSRLRFAIQARRVFPLRK
jgi:hypothetical protein